MRTACAAGRRRVHRLALLSTRRPHCTPRRSRRPRPRPPRPRPRPRPRPPRRRRGLLRIGGQSYHLLRIST